MVLPEAHQTLSGAQVEHLVNWPLSGFLGKRSAIIHQTVRCAPDMSGVHQTCPVSQRSNGRIRQRSIVVNSKKVNNVQVRSQGSEVKTHRACVVCHWTVRWSKRTKDFNGQPLQTPTVC
jgi:hypothetical protein